MVREPVHQLPADVTDHVGPAVGTTILEQISGEPIQARQAR